MTCWKCGGHHTDGNGFCLTCGRRYYGTAPATHGKRADPLACPECGGRVYGSWSGKGPTCNECVNNRSIAVILRQTPDMSRARRRW